MLVDSHCHLHDLEFFSADEREAALRRARERGVEKIVCIGTDPEDSMAAKEFAERHENVFWTWGIHPEETGGFPAPTCPSDTLRAALAKSSCSAEQSGPGNLPSAIGEVGLDYHSEGYDREGQIRLFEEMLQLARDLGLPMSFHVRNAFSDFFPVVANFPGTRGVVHCFTDSKKNLRRILEETEFYVGVDGVATYSTIATPPLERILLETDAPFLAPVPHRGEKNEPSFVADTAEWLSKKLGVSVEEVARKTTENAEKLFRL